MSRVFIVALLACSVACGSKKDDPTKSNLAAFQSGEPVKFETLQGFLPDDGYLTREGWHKSDLTGMALTVPIRGAQASVTLRKDKMYEFLDRLVTTALPRVRDFRGISPKSFDGRGNYAMGIKEHIVFLEIDYDRTETVWGMDIIFQTSAKTDDEARALLAGFQMPFTTN